MGEDAAEPRTDTSGAMDQPLDPVFMRACLDNAPDPVFVNDAAGRLLYCNTRYRTSLGLAAGSLRASDIERFRDALAAALPLTVLRDMKSGQSLERRWRYLREDDSVVLLDVHLTCFGLEGEPCFVGIGRRPPVAGEAAGYAKSDAFYEALSQISHGIVLAHTSEDLFSGVCRALVDIGGFSMAWVGWFDAESRKLVPVAACGDESGYLEHVTVDIGHPTLGSGPSGKAFESGTPQISNDLLANPWTLPWRQELVRSGFRASAALPILRMGKVGGTLNVYSSEAGAFGEREIALLNQAAGDISFALDNFQREQERVKAEETARLEKRFSDVIIDSMPGILYLYDETGKFLRWNRNFEHVSGYTGEQIVGMHPLDFFAPGEHAALSRRIAEVFEQGESAVEAGFLCKDGSSTPFLFTGRRVEFSGKTCLVGVGIDISQRKQVEAALRDAERRFELVVENLNEGLVIADEDGDLLHWNPHSLRLLGFEDLAEGRRQQRDFDRIFEISTLDGAPLPPQEWPLARTRRGEPVENLELRVSRAGTSWTRIFSYNGGRVRYGEGKELAFMTLNDITARKHALRMLEESHEDLERKVAERTGELATALGRAESADRLKSAFLATMSHELRTPLNSIIGFTGIILQGLAGPLNPEQQRQLGMVKTSAHHLLELINDVLDISKIEAGQIELRPAPFALRESLQRVVDLVRPLAEKKNLRLVTNLNDAPDTLISDRRRVEQILLNLLHNAIKFTEQGQIRLDARIQQGATTSGPNGSAPMLRLSVSDSGMGIRPEDMGKLFQPFRQVDTGLTRQHEGTGLGLAICHRLSRLLGGDISVQSHWQAGSTFTVELPMTSGECP